MTFSKFKKEYASEKFIYFINGHFTYEELSLFDKVELVFVSGWRSRLLQLLCGNKDGFYFLGRIFIICLKDFFNESLIVHELIHVRQQFIDGFIKYKFKYAVDYIVQLFKHRFLFGAAYVNISYEKEAFKEQKKFMKFVRSVKNGDK